MAALARPAPSFDRLANEAAFLAIKLATRALLASAALSPASWRKPALLAAIDANAAGSAPNADIALESFASAAKAALSAAMAGSPPLSAAALKAAKLLAYCAKCAPFAEIAAKAPG